MACVWRSEDNLVELVLSFLLYVLEIELKSSGLLGSTLFPAQPSHWPFPFKKYLLTYSVSAYLSVCESGGQ